MTVSSRLALAMVVLVVVTSCVVSAFAYYFVAGAPPHGALTAIMSAALAGGAIAPCCDAVAVGSPMVCASRRSASPRLRMFTPGRSKHISAHR
jgi:hypothetical protein